MDIVLTTLILLLTVAISGVLIGILPVDLPRPLVQIALGAALAIPSFGLHVELQPDLFFLLFVAPLLFTDAWHMPKREFRRLIVPITTLAVGLVIVTVLCVGLFMHWLIPSLPLAACFALGAVLSPTDAVSVTAITGRTPIPPRLLHILQGESLMNDASGLVALQFAVAAALTGSFSLFNATIDFFVIALGGLAVGWAIAWLFSQLRYFLNRWRGSDPSSHVALVLLLPFAAYLLAEHLGVSGILSAVAAGMTLNSVDTLKGELTTRMQTGNLWAMQEFVFNGIVFLLLGLQLPNIMSHAVQTLETTQASGLWRLAFYPLAITLLLMATRFVWVSVLLKLLLVRARRLGEQLPARLSLAVVGATTLAGVRGAITLAAVLSIPLVTPGGSTFPGRGLLVLIAAGVILISLVSASGALPMLLRRIRLPDEDPRSREERQARAASAEAAVRRLDAERERISKTADNADDAAIYADIATRVMASYQPWLDRDSEVLDRQRMRRGYAVQRDLRLAALDAEREELYRLYHAFHINDITLRRIMHDLDLTEASIRGRRGAPHQ